jgi:hypothetical protein
LVVFSYKGSDDWRRHSSEKRTALAQKRTAEMKH